MVEFNNGFVTALCLFYGHRFQFSEGIARGMSDIRIYGASDHLYDIQFPKNLDKRLKKKIQKFIGKVFAVRLKDIKHEEGSKLFDECLEIIKAIDRKYFGFKRVIVKYE
jgi:hypothetical protein